MRRRAALNNASLYNLKIAAAVSSMDQQRSSTNYHVATGYDMQCWVGGGGGGGGEGFIKKQLVGGWSDRQHDSREQGEPRECMIP
jgi:hypothetical protein